MQRGLVAAMGLASACSFSSNPNPADPPDGPKGVDAAVVDGMDPMAAGPRRKSITFDFTKVNETEKDFPAWIDLTDAEIAARAQADGRDIYFTASDGTTRLDHELRSVDLANRRITAWVRIPSLSGSAPATVIYVHYGDPGAAQASNAPGVFKASYAAVWHLDDALPATTIADATGAHPGTPRVTAVTSGAGKLGRGLKFTGAVNDRIEFTNSLRGNSPHTISVWVDQANLNRTAAIVVAGRAEMGRARFLHGYYGNVNTVATGFYSQDWVPDPRRALSGQGWKYVTWVFEGPNRKNHLYVDGVEVLPELTTPSNPDTEDDTGYIGYAPVPTYGSPNNAYEGTLDELRIATVARSAKWIAAEHANQSSPSTFYAVGAEEKP